MVIEVKPSEYKIEGLKVKIFFDEKFIKLLEERIENIRYLHSCFGIYGIREGEENESMIERLVIGHETKEDENNRITTIGSTKSETSQILLEIVKEYLKQKEDAE